MSRVTTHADDRPPRRADQPTDHLHELAEVERLLREDTRITGSHVDVDPSGARIIFDSAPYNQHTRGSLTASLCNEIAATTAWGLSTVHDHHHVEDTVHSTLTVVYAPETTHDGSDVEADHGDGFDDADYVDRETAAVCIRALAQDLEHDNLAAAQIDARDLRDAITPGEAAR